MKYSKIIFLILFIGVLYKMAIVWGGNFIFNMDNARDFLDVREILVLKNLRFIGPTSAIDGVYNGPLWYYLLAIPFFISAGDPFAGVLLMIFLWFVGGIFLLRLISKYGLLPLFLTGIVWIFSNYFSLLTMYSFNPNPVGLLTPLFIYLLISYLKTKRLVFIFSAFFLGGVFFNFEMNFGVFIPLIILFTCIATNNTQLIKSKNFFIGSLGFFITLLPQIIFDIKNNFLMFRALINHLYTSEGIQLGNLFGKIEIITQKFLNSFYPTLFNNKNLALLILLAALIVFLIKKNAFKDRLIIICLIYIFLPFIGYIILPVTLNSWHLGGVMAATIILFGVVLGLLMDLKVMGKVVMALVVVLVFYSTQINISNLIKDKKTPSMDPSVFANEIKAIDYVYQKAEGKNFRVYIYLPSVYDYPYQYLFWWYGQKRYQYLPSEYSYLPNKPEYIKGKNTLKVNVKNEESGLIFLIKQPQDEKLKDLWEDNFESLILMSTEKVGPLDIEIRRNKI